MNSVKILALLSTTLVLTSCVISLEPRYSKSDIEYWYELRADPWKNIDAEDDILGVYLNGEKTESVILRRISWQGPYYNAVETDCINDTLKMRTSFYNSKIWTWNFEILTPMSSLERGKHLSARIVHAEAKRNGQKDTLENASIWFDSVYSEGDYTHLIGGFEFEGTLSNSTKVVGSKGVFHDKTRTCFFPDEFYDKKRN